MKLIQVTDLHLVEPGLTNFGIDPLARLEAVIASINALHADADLVIFSGDLANDCELAAYQALAERLEHLIPDWRLMTGNHDDRAHMRSVFGTRIPEGEFIQHVIDLPQGRVLLLDTLSAGEVPGTYCTERLAWLSALLADVDAAYVFMHHPPMDVGIESLDAVRLRDPDAEALHAALARHGNVRHIFAGHVHRIMSGVWRGLPFAIQRSTSHQTALKFTGAHEVSFEKPTYAVILADEQSVVVHPFEFE